MVHAQPFQALQFVNQRMCLEKKPWLVRSATPVDAEREAANAKLHVLGKCILNHLRVKGATVEVRRTRDVLAEVCHEL